MSRPTKYKEEYNEQAYKLCLLGATDKDMADFFEVDEATINRWKDKHPEFCESLKRGKIEADSVIASKLFHRAKGYAHEETITASHQGEITDMQTITKHYPPDTTAAIFWLKNRQPRYWRDKQELDVGGELKHDHNVEETIKTDDETKELLKQLYRKQVTHSAGGTMEDTSEE